MRTRRRWPMVLNIACAVGGIVFALLTGNWTAAMWALASALNAASAFLETARADDVAQEAVQMLAHAARSHTESPE